LCWDRSLLGCNLVILGPLDRLPKFPVFVLRFSLIMEHFIEKRRGKPRRARVVSDEAIVRIPMLDALSRMFVTDIGSVLQPPPPPFPATWLTLRLPLSPPDFIWSPNCFLTHCKVVAHPRVLLNTDYILFNIGKVRLLFRISKIGRSPSSFALPDLFRSRRLCPSQQPLSLFHRGVRHPLVLVKFCPP